MFACLANLLEVPAEAVADSAQAVATLPLSLGGLGMRSSVRLRHAAHWASWADSIKMITERHPEVSTMILRAVDRQHASPSFMGVVPVCRLWLKLGSCLQVGNCWRREQPKFRTFSTLMSPTSQERGGRQQQHANPLQQRRQSVEISRGTPRFSAFHHFPDGTCRFDAQLFRILLLRRLRLPLPPRAQWQSWVAGGFPWRQRPPAFVEKQVRGSG